MGQFNWSMQGKNVRLGLVSTVTSNTSSVPIGIFDANNNPVTLLLTERLVIDFIDGQTSTGTADILAAPAGTSTATSSTLIATIAGTNYGGLAFDTKEGLPIPVGVVPSVLASSATAQLKVRGAGRIMEGTTQGVRPDWQALQTPLGSF